MSKTKEEIVEHLKEAGDGTQPSGLAGKLAYIMGQVKRISKNGYNEFHKYAFPLEGDVSDMVREQLSEQRVAFYPEMVDYSCERVNTGRSEAWHFIIKHRFTFVDSDSGEERTMSWISEAMDTSDKAANKCATSGEKFFLLKTFLISSGDDPDSGGLEVKGETKKQSGANQDMAMVLQSAARAKGIEWDKLSAFMQENGSDPFSMNPEEAKKWLNWIETRQAKKPDAAKPE